LEEKLKILNIIKSLKKYKKTYLRKKEYYKLKASGNFTHLKKGVKCKYKWYGNFYGGFYACPTLLNNNSIIYSFGIGEDISFSKAIIKQFQCAVFGFDPTPKSIHWIKSQNTPTNFHFYNFGIGTTTEIVNFFLPKIKTHISGSLVNHTNVDNGDFIEVQIKSFEDITKELKHTKIDILKMDIEGSEYDVIDSILNSPIIIDQVLIEFHDRFYKNGKEKTIRVINSFKEKGYEIFAISDTFDEISFIRKKALKL